MPHLVYIALGSNLGDRAGHLATAIHQINTLAQTQVRRQSAVLETKPVGGPAGQGHYLNAVLEISTELAPGQLLAALLEIERAMGRDRRGEPYHGPRVIDLDILLFDGVVCATPDLTIPHPRMVERAFVLGPLAELAPDLEHPVLKVPIRTLLSRLAANPDV